MLLEIRAGSLAADSVSYRSSDFLQSQLARLTSVTQSTEKIIRDFAGPTALGAMKYPTFTRDASSISGFDSLKAQLAQLDQDRQQMKETVISRFDDMVSAIEAKLRQRAAALANAEATPAVTSTAPAATPEPAFTPSQVANERTTLYIESLPGPEIERRKASLEKAKQLLIVLQTGAENPQNRRTLTDAEAQLEQLESLLPPVPEPVQATTPAPTGPTPSTNAQPTPPPKTFNAEKVANELRANRFQVRAAISSAWELDEAFAQASESVSVESGKCRAASLAVKGIWLSFFGQVGLAVLATLLVAFLILVFADLTQTLLDTATNTGITAETVQRTDSSSR
ncbi:MAG: hypothetical protein ABI233_00830 [Chthoniobacterales bacterium]